MEGKQRDPLLPTCLQLDYNSQRALQRFVRGAGRLHMGNGGRGSAGFSSLPIDCLLLRAVLLTYPVLPVTTEPSCQNKQIPLLFPVFEGIQTGGFEGQRPSLNPGHPQLMHQ